MFRFIRPSGFLLAVLATQIAPRVGWAEPTPAPPVNVPYADQLAAIINDKYVYRFITEPDSAFSKRYEDADEHNNYTVGLAVTREWRQAAPQSAAAAYNQGVALFYMGDFAAALTAWKQATQLQPDLEFPVQEWTGRTQKILGRYPNLVLPPVHWIQGDAAKRIDEITRRGRSLFAARKWDEIEKVVASLAQSKDELADGSWKLTWFFGSLWGIPAGQETELTWRKHRDAVQTWSTARPHSALAKLAVARCWVDGAWLARGDNYASETAPESMKRMDQRLTYASSCFKDSHALLVKTPLWTSAFQQFSQIAGVDDESYNAVFDAATQHFPTYSNFSVLRSIHLAPRWYGEPGDWERFAIAQANAVAKTRGTTTGDILYARIVWGQQKQFDFDNIWHETKASWPRTKRGLLALQKRYPNSLAVTSITVKLATIAHDFDFAKQILDAQIKGHVEHSVWNNMREFYDFRLQILEHGEPKWDIPIP